MNNGKPVILQMQSLISRFDFEKLVKEHNADKNVRTFPTWNLLKVMLFAHCSGKKSLRDICISFSSMSNRLYHLGIGSLSRNNLSNSLARRDAGLFEKLFYQLLHKVVKEAGTKKDRRFKFKNDVIAIDSTTISLCLSLCEWASFRSTKAGVKIHTMYDVKKQMPEFMVVTEAQQHDTIPVADMPLKPQTIYVLDRGYMSFKILENINENKAFFVTRTKENTQYGIIRKNKTAHSSILYDAEISFTGLKSDDYSGSLRLVRFENPDDAKVYEFITNNMELSAATIASIYKSRWDIELFFKWIKQNLKIKSFFGLSKNAILIQIWTAAIAYLLVSYIRFLSNTALSITDVFRVIGSNIMSDRSIHELLTRSIRQLRRQDRQLYVQLDFGF
jgi:hypothetical protein